MTWTYTLGQLAEAVGGILPKVASGTVFSAVSTDTRTLKAGDVFFALSGENFNGNRFVQQAFQMGAAAAVCDQPMEGGTSLVVNSPLRALQEFSAWHRCRCKANIIAITGSCGKTTSKDIVSAVLASKFNVVKTQGNLNNDIGCPLSLLRMDESTQQAVIEMGANHVGEIAALCRLAKPDESVVTMVAPAHLEGFGSIEGVALAKSEIVAGLREGGLFYVNVDSPWCLAMAEKHHGPKMFFGSHGDVSLKSCKFDNAGDMVLDVDPIGRLRLPLTVRAHATNVLFAVAVALRHGMDDIEAPLRAACGTLSRFKVIQVGPLTVLDDSYNANPASMMAALQALMDRPGTGERIAVLGEMRELGDASAGLHREVGHKAGEFGVSRLYTYGDHASDIASGASETGVKHALPLPSHESIAELLYAESKPGDTVLVKGSRGVTMEKVIEYLGKLYGVDIKSAHGT